MVRNSVRIYNEIRRLNKNSLFLSGKANSPPKFALDGAGEIVVKVREGQESVGKKLFHIDLQDNSQSS